MSEKCCSGVTNVETMRLGSELTLLTNLFPDLHATVVGGLTAIHENIILMQVSTVSTRDCDVLLTLDTGQQCCGSDQLSDSGSEHKK